MLIGCCMGLGFLTEDTDCTLAGALIEKGFDYVELPLTAIASLSDNEFERLCAVVEREGIKVYACNLFISGEIKLTGPEVSHARLVMYIEHAFARAVRLGVRVFVVGSAGARNVPNGFSYEDAWTQLTEAFQIIADKAMEYNAVIAVEPLNKKESNVINTLADGRKCVAAVDRSNMRLLADYFHMVENGESVSVAPYSDILAHTHFAAPITRQFPDMLTDSCRLFLHSLREIGYEGGISLECNGDLLRDAPVALGLLREFLK